jgi:DNA mismatch repair ATPase MutS
MEKTEKLLNQIDLSKFSLIYPDERSQIEHYEGKSTPNIDMFVLEELGLLEAFSLKSSDLDEFFTSDPKVIEHRMAVFADMLAFPQISVTLNRLFPILTDIMELRRLEADFGDNTESYLESITEIELYISSISTLHDGFSEIKDSLTSDAFKTLAQRIDDLVCSDYYAELNTKLSELTNRVRDIKSVTIGVNLDAQLRPSSAGVLSINPESFHSGDVIDKILRLNFKDNEYTCIANLVPFNKKQSENQRTALSLAFNSAINDVYKQSLRSWKKIVQSFVLENTDFLLNLMPEIEFLVKATNLLRTLSDKGLTLCKPEIVTDRNVFIAKDLYNPCVALKVEGEIIANDVEFDNDVMIFVLTGPNRGGKSVITCAIGLAQAMLQLGMFVPAASATISIADGIYTHFPTGADDTIDKGRLGEECARLRDIFHDVTKDSLVLLDESLSSTGSYEASYIAGEVLAGFSRIGCRCLFSTHLHELAAEIDNINARTAPDGGTRIDSLVAGIEDGKRSFKIYRMKPDGKSYARDIADKYGLSYETIVDTAINNR